MNEIVKQHLAAFAAKNNWGTDDDTLIEIITEGNHVYEEKISESRWWNNVYRVAEIDGMFIGYEYAQANRDESVRELGWDFDPTTICQVWPTQKVVTVYSKVNPALKEGVTNTMIKDPNTPQADNQEEATGQAENAQESASQDQAMEATQDSEEGSIEG